MSSDAAESFTAIASGLEMENMDVENVTDIVGDFGDVSGMDQIIKVALTQRLHEHAGTMRAFSIKVEGIVIRFSNICEYDQDNQDGEYDELMLEEGEVGCHIDTMILDGELTWTYNVLKMIDMEFDYITSAIIGLIKARRICKLCDQLIVGMSGYEVCAMCALQQVRHKCCRCNVTRGVTRNRSDAGWEHSACKRRRVMSESD